MKRTKSMVSAIAVMSLSALLAGCSGGVASAAAPVAHKTAPQYGGTLSVALPDAWQPDLIPYLASSAYSQNIWSNQFLPMIGMDPNGKLGTDTGVVDKWTISPDKKTYTFWINKKAMWSDGLHVTAKDVQLGVDWLASKSYNGPLQGIYGYLVQNIVGATAPITDGTTPSGFKIINPYEFQITTIAADAAVLNSQLSLITPLPYFVLGKIPMATWNKIPFDTTPNVGDGPWVTSKVVQGESVVQTANKYFMWGKPYIPTYEFQVIKTALTPGDLAKGTLTAAAIEPKYVAGLKRYQNLKMNISTGYGYTYLVWRLNNVTYKKEFDNVNFRQACEYAINRPAYIKAFEKGYGTPQNGPLPDVSVWYDQALKNQYPYNPGKANQLLDQAGFKIGKNGWRMTPGGRPFQPTITYPTGSQTIAEETQAIATFLRAVKIDVKINPPIDFNSILKMQDNDANGKQPLQGFVEGVSFSGVPDPDPRGAFGSKDSFNLTTWDWSYPDKWTALNDKLIAEQHGVKAFNFAYRKNIIDQWQTVYNDRLPMIFLTNVDAITAYQSNLQNVNINALGWFYPWKMYFSK